MSAWWSGLSERDRRMLSIGGVVVAVLLFWALWFDPLLQSRRSLADSVKLALADASAREAQLANVLKRIEPVSAGRVSVWLEAAPFDAMAGWLEQLQNRYGIRAEEFSVSLAAAPGQVDARIVLVDPAN